MMEKCETGMKEKQHDSDYEEKKSITEKDSDSTAVVAIQKSEPITKPMPFPCSIKSQNGRLN